MLRFFLPLYTLFICFVAVAQERPQNGLAPTNPKYIAFVNVNILVNPNKTILDGTVLVEGQRIVQVGKMVSIPKEALIYDCKQQWILPSFIELNASYGFKVETKPYSFFPQIENSNPGPYYWNEAIHPEINTPALFKRQKEEETKFLQMGFSLVASHYADGIARGTGVLNALGPVKDYEMLLSSGIASYFSFDKGTSQQTYPSSLMGSIALLKQYFYDYQWYKTQKNKNTSLTFEAQKSQELLPQLFYIHEKYDIQRIAKLNEALKTNFIPIGNGDEYEFLDYLSQQKQPLIIPINFPENYNLTDPYLMEQISLGDLKHWELAPSNPYFLQSKNIPFCITSHGHKDAMSFWKNIRKAIERGLSPAKALESLTLLPAKLLHKDSLLGSVEEGKLANFNLFSSNPFENEAQLLSIVSLGNVEQVQRNDSEDFLGTYDIQLKNKKYLLQIKGTEKEPKSILSDPKNVTNSDTLKTTVKTQVNGQDITLLFEWKDDNLNGLIKLHAKMNMKFGVFEGDGLDGNGQWFNWSAVRKSKNTENTNPKSIVLDTAYSDKIWFPNIAYGTLKRKTPEDVIITNATVWTNEAEGNLREGTVIVKNGKISFVGTSNYVIPPNAKVIDAKGKHLTCGIIDEHSHIALTHGVNEGGQAITAEVNIGDVVYADDINIYRQLSGGVTTSQLLHGSANPIGGQSALIKLKWGRTPEQMKIPNAPGFIKFALGENVKQTNWGDFQTVRFPQTRMGVEQVYVDAFTRALKYQEERQKFLDGKSKQEPRKDLELEILVEILNSKRFITCHSYVQSEINMLMHVADSFGFKINTFTHILEGYKLADKMKKHGVAGSTFADWWAYKFEVNDAIPYNAKIMHDQGVLVAINSDDAEMGRRLNQEAGKTIKYGGMTPLEAWKLVTLNPAKMLHLDDRIGSIKVGKDADLVLWDANPLSIYAKVEFTMIEGTMYYSRQENENLEKLITLEKARLLAKMLGENNKGAVTQAIKLKKERHWHCDTIGIEGSTGVNQH